MKPLKIGLTGGLGSGKTYVAAIFQTLGIPVFSSDTVSKEITAADPLAAKEIRAAFGNSVFNSDGLLLRRELAAIVFNNPENLALLNSILHPKVIAAFDSWYESQQNVPYIIKEAAILFESNTNIGLDRIITVNAPVELRIHRGMMRDKASAEEIKSRISRQLSEEERIRRSDYVIVNDEEQMLLPQIYKLHQALTM